MHLRIVTPHGPKVDSDITEVTAPGEVGDMGILPGHRPLLAGLGIGLLSYGPADGGVQHLAVNGGYLEVDNDDVIVVTETAEAPDEIDHERAKAALAKAQEELSGVDLSRTEDVARIHSTIRRAENRIEAVKLVKTRVPN